MSTCLSPSRRPVWLFLLAIVTIAGTAERAAAQSCSAGSAIQSQLSALAATGGKVSLPCGCWTLTQSLSMPSHTALEGEGICTVIYAPAGGTAIVGDYNARRYGLAVRELLIERLCRSFSSTSPCSRGIHLGNGAAATKIEGVRLEDTDIGVHLDNGSVDAVGVSQYCTNNTVDRKNDITAYRWIGTACGSEH